MPDDILIMNNVTCLEDQIDVASVEMHLHSVEKSAHLSNSNVGGGDILELFFNVKYIN